MAKKQFFLIIDTETTITDKVADFGAVICDRQGVVVKQAAIMVADTFEKDSLFYARDAGALWSAESVQRRTENYRSMLQDGRRMLASVTAINRWLSQAAGAYDPELTAYNLAFDVTKCKNTGIDLNIFPNRFCLWHASVGNICKRKDFRQFVLENHRFNSPTDLGNMTYSTSAETVAGFLNGGMSDEPHTALEDIIGFEVPILKYILSKRKWREKMKPYNWKEFQVRDAFSAKSGEIDADQ